MSATKRVLVTGASGFIGKNLVLALRRHPAAEVFGVDIDSPRTALEQALDICDVIFHLAGVNRPEKESEFDEGNLGSLTPVLRGLERRNRHPLIVLSSSTQALLSSSYGQSKKRAEDTLLEYATRTGTPARIFRLPGVFGKWCRPNYNSVVATFCHNVARDLPIQISDPAREIEIVHVDDVVTAFLALINEEVIVQGVDFALVEPIYRITLGALADKIRQFRAGRETLVQPNLTDPFDHRLYGTYSSYLPEDEFDYRLAQKIDDRGILAELLKLGGHGQIFISRSHPGITRGNHYHDIKVEKFVVLDGEAILRFRHMATGELVEYPVVGREMRVVDIPPGWTHSIENVGPSDMIVLFWASEVFDSARSDTYAAEVKK